MINRKVKAGGVLLATSPTECRLSIKIWLVAPCVQYIYNGGKHPLLYYNPHLHHLRTNSMGLLCEDEESKYS